MPTPSGKTSVKPPKVKPTFSRLDWLLEGVGWLSLPALWVYILFLWKKLPAQIPIHFNGALKPDAFGSKNELFVLAGVGSLLFMGISFLNQFPHLFNYPVTITPENAKTQYTRATRFLRVLKMAILWLFAGIAGLSGLHAQSASLWVTSGDQSRLLQKMGHFETEHTDTAAVVNITLQPDQTYQTIEGFGAALTGSSAYLINRGMDSRKRSQLLEELFSRDKGIGLSYLRLTMGASDFSVSDFTYSDLPSGTTDFNLTHFSLAQDTIDLIPVIHEIQALSPYIQLMASPWSPPAWMKTSGKLAGGKLRPDHYEVYARYFVRYIREMEKQGIQITAITPQNEPLHFKATYPCMEMQASEQADFIKHHLGPLFKAQGIDTRIIVYDHNWNRPDYPLSLLNDPEAKPFIAGAAFHAYAGKVEAMGIVQKAHPDTDLYFTEISGGDWAPDFSDNLMWYLRNVLFGSLRQGARAALFWNLALNEQHGPTNGGCQDCRGVVTLLSDGSIQYNEEYYALAHFSKFVKPGAMRIDCTTDETKIDLGMVAFKNPDGQIIAVVANFEPQAHLISLRLGKETWHFEIPPLSVATWTNQD